MAVVTGTGSSQGVTFKKGAGSAVAFLNSIDGLDLKANTLDTTTLDVASGYKTFISGFKEVADVSLSGFYSPKDHDIFVTDFNSGVAATYTITFPPIGGGTAVVWSFTGIVTGFKHKAAVDNVITCDITIKVSGAPTFTAAV
jgi:predicted secreted protein